jgi:hypothetical protein
MSGSLSPPGMVSFDELSDMVEVGEQAGEDGGLAAT